MDAAKLMSIRSMCIAFSAILSLYAAPAVAQVQSVDPDAAIDGDLYASQTPSSAQPETPSPSIDIAPTAGAGNGTPIDNSPVDNWNAGDFGKASSTSATAAGGQPVETTYPKDDLLGAAEGVFGTGSQGLAGIIEDLLAKQGQPNGYIVGREGGGAFAFGLRYGSGTLHHKIEGDRPVYWTGPSLGLDIGLNAGKAFVLVYNLHDTADLYRRFGAGEGQAYLVGGFHVSYLRRGDVVLIPVRMGAGLRLGANVGYMRFSQEQRWLPF